MRLHKLNETALRITANKVPEFLNGLISNAIDAPLNAFLNQHGRIIATVRRIKMSDSEALLAVPATALDNLVKHLDRYAKLSKATLSVLPDALYMDLDTKEIVIGPQDETRLVSDEEFNRFRLEQNIPLMGIDYQADEFILNVHEHNYTSYTKGCFLGQEPVAKVHNRSQPSKKLVVKFEDQCADEEKPRMSSKAADPVDQRVKGFVFISNKSS